MKVYVAKIITIFLLSPLKTLGLLMILALFGIDQISSQMGTLLSELLLIVILIVIFGLYKKKVYSSLSFKPLRTLNILLLLPLSLIARLPVFLLFFLPLITADGLSHALNSQAIAGSGNLSWPDYLLLVISVVLVGPIFEELFHRGIIFNLLKSKLPIWVAVILSAFIFSLTHFNPILILTTFSSGLLFTYVYYRFGNILYPIILHSLVNLFPFLVRWIF